MSNFSKKELDALHLLTGKIKEQFALDIHSHHGISHWERVGKIGIYLAAMTSADPYVVSLFSILHDSRRENEGYDSGHGPRASKLTIELYRTGLLPIDAKQLERLVYACKHHTGNGAQSNDITIQTCWDSDRLDLYRVNEVPNPKFLYTEMGKRRETIDFALELYLKK